MYKKITAEELARFIHPLAHSARIQIIQELRVGELDVTTLQKIIAMPQSSVSQHLAILKSHHLLKERKDGRRVFYSLIAPELADWLLSGIELLSKSEKLDDLVANTMNKAKQDWANKPI
jgi:DNA-binding transcriptional ArsR family regulator